MRIPRLVNVVWWGGFAVICEQLNSYITRGSWLKNMNTDVILVATLFVVLIGLNVFVSRLVHKSDCYEPTQKKIQYMLIWLLPLIGSVLCYVFVREKMEHPGGTYPLDTSLYDDGIMGMDNSGRDYLGGGHHSE